MKCVSWTRLSTETGWTHTLSWAKPGSIMRILHHMFLSASLRRLLLAIVNNAPIIRATAPVTNGAAADVPEKVLVNPKEMSRTKSTWDTILKKRRWSLDTFQSIDHNNLRWRTLKLSRAANNTWHLLAPIPIALRLFVRHKSFPPHSQGGSERQRKVWVVNRACWQNNRNGPKNMPRVHESIASHLWIRH